MYKDFDDLISQWGNLAGLARDLDVWPENMTKYKKEGIRAKYFCKLVESARKNKIKGVTFKLLAKLAEERG